MSKLLKKLIDLVLDAIESDRVLQSDIDAIAMITDAAKEELPELFLDIVNNIQANYGFDEDWKLQDNLMRLVRVYDTAKMISDIGISATENFELNPTFSLKPKERQHVLELCAKMRKIVLASTVFDEPHKKRLLNRIAAMETEILKDKGRFDVILAGVTDVGETLEKFGKNIKPLTDRMTEIANLTRSKTEAYEQIPAPDDVKRIEDKSGDDNK